MTNETQGPASGEHPDRQDVLLPHDRDEQPQTPVDNGQHHENRKPIDQAHRDVEGGIQDTERIGTPNDLPSSDANR